MANNESVVREITDPAEFAGVAKVIRESFKTVAEEFNLTKENVPTNPAFLNVRWLKEKKRDSDNARFFGLFEGKKPASLASEGTAGKQIGFVLVEKVAGSNPALNIAPGSNAYWIEKLAVLPEYRHGGSGAKLIEFAVDYIRKQGGQRVVLGMMDEHTVLKSWYRKLGFNVIHSQKYPHLPFTVSFMERDSSPLP